MLSAEGVRGRSPLTLPLLLAGDTGAAPCPGGEPMKSAYGSADPIESVSSCKPEKVRWLGMRGNAIGDAGVPSATLDCSAERRSEDD